MDESKYSPEMLEIVRAWNACGTANEGDELDAQCERFNRAIDHLIKRETPSLSHVGELALVWRLRLWHGDSCHSVDENPKVELALWKAIEKVSGMSLREVQTVELV